MSAWQAAFTPEALLLSGNLPQYLAGYTPSENPRDALILMPNFVYGADYAWLDECRCNGCEVVEFGEQTREELIQLIRDNLIKLNGGKENDSQENQTEDGSQTPREEENPSGKAPLSPEPFYALGFVYLLSEMIMRRVRYTSFTDSDRLNGSLQAAAAAWKSGDSDSLNQKLQEAADCIIQGKEYYFPTENYLCDYCVVSSVKQFPTLTEMLFRLQDESSTESQVKPAFFMSGRLLEEYKSRQPENFETLMGLLKDKKTVLVSGEYTESPLPIMTREGILDRLFDAMYRFKQNTGGEMKLYGRLSNGLTPLLPGILKNLGFSGAIFCSFDQRKLPKSEKCKINWTGLGADSIPAYAQEPFDIESAAGVLGIPEFIASHAEGDYSLAAVSVHSPGELNTMASSLAQYYFSSARWGAILGSFTALDAYFANTFYSGEETEFLPDDFQYSFLIHDLERNWPDPLSRWGRYYRCARLIAQTGNLEFMASALGRLSPGEAITEQYGRINQSVMKKDSLKSTVESFETELNARADSAAQAIAQKIFAPADRDKVGRNAGASITGLVAVNGLERAVEELVDVSALPAAPELSDTVKRVFSESKQALVEIPPMGCVWIPAGKKQFDISSGEKDDSSTPSNQTRKTIIRNNIFQLTFDPATGALVNVYDFHTRRNFLAQTLAVRLGGIQVEEIKDDTLDYSISVADSMEVISDDSQEKMVVSGRLVDREMHVLYRFTQTTTLHPDSSKIGFDIELNRENCVFQPVWGYSSQLPACYAACRWAWGMEDAQTFISVGGAAVESGKKELLSPEFIQLRSDQYNLTILPGGLPWHRRIGQRRMDTLLGVAGESETRFHLDVNIALNANRYDNPSFQSAHSLSGCRVVPVYDSAIPKQSAASVLELSIPNAQITSAWLESEKDAAEKSAILRIQETAGVRSELQLDFFRRAKSAQINNFLGEKKRDLDLDAGRPILTLQPYDWVEAQIILE